jgi:hypothetical protein
VDEPTISAGQAFLGTLLAVLAVGGAGAVILILFNLRYIMTGHRRPPVR